MSGLSLPTRPYCVGCAEQNLSKIVDDEGNNAGMATFIDAMSRRAGPNVHFFVNAEVVRLSRESHLFNVLLANGTSVTVWSLILALPQQPLLKLLHSSPSVVVEGTRHPSSLDTYRSLHRIRASPAVKLYVHYENAWWINYLNLTSGEFNNSAAPHEQTSATAVPQFPPLQGRYHDGDVRCTRIQGGLIQWCRGFLEATYAFDDVSVAFYRPYRAGDGRPFTVIGGDPTDVTGTDFLEAVHQELVHFHAEVLTSYGVMETVSALRPSQAVLAIWDEAAQGFGGAIHDWFRDGRDTSTCSGFSDCQQHMPPQLMQPLSPLPLYVAGEAFGARNGWMESALAMVENILHSFYNMTRPSWIDEDTYTTGVLYGSSRIVV